MKTCHKGVCGPQQLFEHYKIVLQPVEINAKARLEEMRDGNI